jgi:uncharacterized protein
MSRSKLLPRWKSPRALLRAILSLDDSAHSIAKGTAVGMFLGLTPTVGIQMILVMLVSLFVRFNRKAALITVYISNPFTMIPLYWANYKVGTLFFSETVSRDDFQRLLTYHDFPQWMNAIHAVFIEVGLPLVFGSLIVATVGGVVTYPTMRWLLRLVGKDKPLVDHPEKNPETAAEQTGDNGESSHGSNTD